MEFVVLCIALVILAGIAADCRASNEPTVTQTFVVRGELSRETVEQIARRSGRDAARPMTYPHNELTRAIVLALYGWRLA